MFAEVKLRVGQESAANPRRGTAEPNLHSQSHDNG